MKIYNGGIGTATGLNISNNTPSDDRFVVDTYSGLTALTYKYDGLTTKVQDENKFYSYDLATDTWSEFGGGDTSGLVPYVGASQNVQLGLNSINGHLFDDPSSITWKLSNDEDGGRLQLGYANFINAIHTHSYIYRTNGSDVYALAYPNANGTFVTSVNGFGADSEGNIELSLGGSQDLQSVLDYGSTANISTDLSIVKAGIGQLSMSDTSFYFGGLNGALTLSDGGTTLDSSGKPLTINGGGGGQINMNPSNGVTIAGNSGGITLNGSSQGVQIQGAGGAISLVSGSQPIILDSSTQPQIIVSGDVSVFSGITYSDDFSSSYTDRSLIDKAYLNSRISGFTSGSTTTPTLEQVTTEGSTTSHEIVSTDGTNSIGIQPTGGIYFKNGGNMLTLQPTTITADKTYRIDGSKASGDTFAMVSDLLSISDKVGKSGDTMTGTLVVPQLTPVITSGSTVGLSGTPYNTMYSNSFYGPASINIGSTGSGGNINFYTGGVYRLQMNGAGTTIYPIGTNTMSLGLTGNRWSNVYSTSGDFTGTVLVGDITPTSAFLGNVGTSAVPFAASNIITGSFSNVRARLTTMTIQNNSASQIGAIYSTGNWNIGTGTTDTGYKLNVEGVGRFTGSLTVNALLPEVNYGTIIGGQASTFNTIWANRYRGNIILPTQSNINLTFRNNTDTTQATLFQTMGNFNIGSGTTDTGYKLNVEGSGRFTSDLIANSDMEITDNTKGVILKSPDGTRYRITVNNGGTLTTTAL